VAQVVVFFFTQSSQEFPASLCFASLLLPAAFVSECFYFHFLVCDMKKKLVIHGRHFIFASSLTKPMNYSKSNRLHRNERLQKLNRKKPSPLLNARIRIVIVDALEIFRLDFIPAHPRIRIQPHRHVAH
jgi:hypothetical protein